MKTHWCPTDFNDEGMAWLPRPEDWLDPDMTPDLTCTLTAKPGDVVLFDRSVEHGAFTVRIGPDGLITAPLRDPHTPDLFTGQTEAEKGVATEAIPLSANWFWLTEEDECAGESLADLAAMIVELGLASDPEGEDFPIGCSTMQEKIPMSLSADGKTFEEVK